MPPGVQLIGRRRATIRERRWRACSRASVPLLNTWVGGRGLTSRRRIELTRVIHSINTTPRIAGSERKAGNYRFSSDALERTTIWNGHVMTSNQTVHATA